MHRAALSIASHLPEAAVPAVLLLVEQFGIDFGYLTATRCFDINTGRGSTAAIDDEAEFVTVKFLLHRLGCLI